MATTTDVCVIGSGFGGGVAALRMAEAGQSVTVLEMGHYWDSTLNPAWSSKPGVRTFEQTNGDMGYWLDLINVAAGVDLLGNDLFAVVGGRGVGGGSLVYSGAAIRAPSSVFADAPWPESVDRAALDPYYDLAEEQLNIKQLTWDDVAQKDGAFGWACQQAGVHLQPHPQVIDPSACTGLGWCNNGCTIGAKQSVDRRYIAGAEARGADVVTGAMAIDIAPVPGGRWQVTYVTTADDTTPNVGWAGTPATVVADQVFVCAGAVNSAALLLRSAPNLPGGVSAHTGRHLATHGDFIIIGILPDSLPSSLDGLDTTVGIVDGCTVFDYLFEPPPGFGPGWQKFILQSVRMLPLAAAMTLDGAGTMAAFGEGPKHLMQKYGIRMLQIGVIGQDGGDGTVSLIDGLPTLSFTTSATTRSLHDGALAAVRHIIEGGGGGRVLTTWTEYRPGDQFSIHPSSSCRMTDSVSTGVVRHDGTVWKPGGGVHDGLHVLDCSVLSGPIAVNTSLTAAALAERAVHLKLAGIV